MNEGVQKGLNELTYADLGEPQEIKMREFEKQFNNEFGTDYYFMVMKKGK